MKEIKAYIRRDKADIVIRKLESAGVKGMTVIDVYALSEWVDKESFSYSIEMIDKYSKVMNLEIVCEDKDAENLMAVIANYGRTGNTGDGMIFLSGIEKSVKIKTGELNII